MSRMYVGHLSRNTTERDLEHFFRGYGRLRDVVIKQGFAFVEFDDRRDAEDAMYDLNGKDCNGDRVVLEMARRDPRGRSLGGGDRYDRGRSPRGGRSPPRRSGLRFSPPHETRYRMVIENLTSRYTWQDVKDMFRDGGFEVTFADAHRAKQNEGVVCFKSAEDLKKAKEKFDGKEINGREIKLVDDSRSRSPGRGRSRSRSAGRRRSPRSKSRSKSPARKGGRDSHSRSKSPAGGRAKSAGSRSRSPRSASPAENGKGGGDKSGDDEKKRSRSRSATPKDD